MIIPVQPVFDFSGTGIVGTFSSDIIHKYAINTLRQCILFTSKHTHNLFASLWNGAIVFSYIQNQARIIKKKHDHGKATKTI